MCLLTVSVMKPVVVVKWWRLDRLFIVTSEELANSNWRFEWDTENDLNGLLSLASEGEKEI